MNKFIKLVSLLIIVVIWIAGCVESESLHQGMQRNPRNKVTVVTNQEQNQWGTPSNGLTSRIWSDQKQFVIGEPILIHYEIKNISDKTQVVWHSGFWLNHRIIVKREDGSEVNLTEKGNRYRNAFSPGGIREKNVPWFLKPSQIDSAWNPHDITQYFLLDSPGMYSVQFLYEEYQGGWEGKLWSNVLSIIIKKS